MPRDNQHDPAPEWDGTKGDKLAAAFRYMAAQEPPSLFSYDLAYWDGYMGGPTDDRLLAHNWPDDLADLAQPTMFHHVPAAECIAAIENPEARRKLGDRLGSVQSYSPTFFKIGHRTTKDAMCVTVDQLRDIPEIMAESERAMEEVAIANAKGQKVAFTFRAALNVDDAREVRVFVRHGLVHAVSTGPYATHTRTEALGTWMLCKDVAESAASRLHVNEAWIDVFHDGERAWLCDINPARPTTWPGHFCRTHEWSDLRELEGEFAYREAIPTEKLIGVDVPGLPTRKAVT